jgi:hypothetical protein
VVDEAGAPIAGARVRADATISRCGPSGPLEGCSFTPTESATAVTDASGAASVCAAGRPRDGWLVVERDEWPKRIVPITWSGPIMLGPPRMLAVEVPATCDGMTHVHVTAQPEGGEQVWATPVFGGMRNRRYELTLGPWLYWVSSHDDRAGNSALEAKACSTFIRTVDARQLPSVLLLDRSDTNIEFPDFAGGRATVTAFRSADVLAAGTLDAQGRATFSLQAGRGTAFCLRLEREHRCRITYARAGETARPDLYVGREREIEASCGHCGDAP